MEGKKKDKKFSKKKRGRKMRRERERKERKEKKGTKGKKEKKSLFFFLVFEEEGGKKLESKKVGEASRKLVRVVLLKSTQKKGFWFNFYLNTAP